MENSKETIKYITSLVLFGMNGILASQIKADSMIIVLVRTFLGSFILLIAFMIKNRKKQLRKTAEENKENRNKASKNRSDKIWLLLSGAGMGLGWLFLYDSFQMIGVGIATMTYYCGPAIVLLTAPIFLTEKINKNKIASFMIVVFGMVLMMIQTMDGKIAVRGIASGLIAAVCYAVMIILGRKNRKIEGVECALYQLLGAFGIVFLFICFKGWQVPVLERNGWISLLILGIVNTGFGCYLYFSAIPLLKIQTVTILGYLEPLSAVVMGMIFLGEHMTFIQLSGVVFVLAGAYLGERKKDIRADIPSSV
ncbi:MAG: DMT family transporter [Lachnospiraceae bacterium]|nr:DMT family transporter [Lachnospiraceae bacterium]